MPTRATKFRVLLRQIYRQPMRLLEHIFAAIGLQWILLQIATHFLPDADTDNSYLFIGMVLVGVAWGLKRIWKPSSITIQLQMMDTTIQILFADLFHQPGMRAIGVTEYFESEIGTPVSADSLHGVFLKRCFGGGTSDFDQQLQRELQNVPSQKVQKAAGKTTAYPIGTTALIRVDNDKYLAFALAKADPQTCKAKSDVSEMWTAMHGLWQKARDEAGGQPLNVPLIGSGLSGVGLRTRELLHLTILSVITETKIRKITGTVRIVLHPDRFDEIDLQEVRKHWEEP